MVDLTPTVLLDIPWPVTVKAEWMGPAGFVTTKTVQLVAGSATTFNNTATINSLGRDQSGDYNCTTTVHVVSSSSCIADSVTISSIRVIVGKTLITACMATLMHGIIPFLED